MLFEDDRDLTTQYYRLRGQHIYYGHVLNDYRHYGALAPALAQFSSLCSGFVHDLSNGLNAIRVRLELLSAERTNLEHVQAIMRAKTFCDGCGWRIYTLRAVSPRPPENYELIDLPQFIGRIMDTLRAWQSPSVQVELRSTQPRMLVADYDNTLRLALLELLLNAFQASPDGGQVSVFVQRLDNGLAQVEIADTGPGLSPGGAEQCFDLRFTTGPHLYGLGLYIARKVIENHRGTLTLLSELGQGTRVIIQLPRGNPEPGWDDEGALVLELETLHDTVAGQKQEIETCQATYALHREQMLTQLSNLFGQLSASTVQFLETGLDGIRHSLAPLSSQMTSESARHIQFILEKCDYCDTLLGNARVLHPALSLHPVPLDLNQIASKVVHLITWRVHPDIQLHLTQTVPLPLVCADVSLITTALLGLIRNALDAAGRNGRVDVQTLLADDAVIVRLTNTGKTIPLDMRVRVFDLDYTTRQDRAFGLGLCVAQAIIARHAGTITIRDTQQTQTEVQVALPRYAGGTW